MMVLSLPLPAALTSRRGPTKLLVVDNIDSNLIAVKALLARHGVELLVARSPGEALRLLLAQDVVIAPIGVHAPHMDGAELAELMRGAPPAPHGKADAFLQLKRHKDELEEQARLLQQTIKLNDTFTAVLGHDLRNPLGAILAIAETIEETTTDDSARKLASRISNSALRMRRMIEQLIDMARARSGGRIPLHRASADLVDLCERAIEEIEARSNGRRTDVVSDGDTTGQWDKDRLMQVLSNLIGNAVRHGDPAHAVSVRIDATRASEVRVSVHNGGAIPAAILPHIFQPFTGLAQDRRHDEGMGLGLYIARIMVEAHGGSIDIRSDLASGTTVEVRLPRHKGTAAPSDDTPAAAGGRQG